MLDEGIQWSKLPNNESLRKNMENSPLNRKGSPRKEDVWIIEFQPKGPNPPVLSKSFNSCNVRAAVDKDLEINFNPFNQKYSNIDNSRCIDSAYKKKYSANKKSRAHSNVLDESNSQYQLLKLIPCEIEDTSIRHVKGKKSAIQEDIRKLLRIMAEATKIKEQKEFLEQSNKNLDYIVTVNDVWCISESCDEQL